MSKMSFTKMYSPARTDEPKEPVESDRCGDYGCPLRADMFIDGHGSCLFHRLGRMSKKNPADITDRIKQNSEKIRTVERYSRAVLKLEGGVVRGVQRLDYGGSDAWSPLVYPAWLPIGESESHVQWLDRARQELNTMIVQNAEKSRYDGVNS